MTPLAGLSPGERILRSWPARSPGDRAGRPVSGEISLTNHRFLFITRVGILGGSRSVTYDRSVPLETIGGAAPHRTEMRIGYGDRMILEGVDIAGATYELGREGSSRSVLTEIASARRARRNELGLPEDITACRSCGRWSAFGTTLCESCARADPVSR